MALSLYDRTKSFQENASADLPPFPRDLSATLPRQPTLLFGKELARPFGIAPACWTTSRGLISSARLGASMLTYKTIRANAHPVAPSVLGQNVLYPTPSWSSKSFADDVISLNLPLPISTKEVAKEPPSNLNQVTIINRFGMGMLDAKFIAADIAKTKAALAPGQILMVSVYGETTVEFVKAAELAAGAGAEAIELNLSCPCVDGKSPLSPEMLPELVKAVRTACPNFPLAIKVPYLEDEKAIDSLVLAAKSAKVDAMVCCNSLPVSLTDVSASSPSSPAPWGLSGAAIRKRVLVYIGRVRVKMALHHCAFTLIGVGGATKGQHLHDILAAGADIALSAAGAMHRPQIILEAAYLLASKQKQLSELSGAWKKVGAVLERPQPFKLKSGKMSSTYVDARLVSSYPWLLSGLVDAVAERLHGDSYDVICGVPVGALALAGALSVRMQKRLLVLRTAVKSHGTQKRIEGQYTKGERVLLIEDVVTSGGSVLEALSILEEEGLNVTRVQCLVLRDEDNEGEEAMAKKGIPFSALFRLSRLRSPVVPGATTPLPLALRELLAPQDSLSARVMRIMQRKKSNLCVAIDLNTPQELLRVAKLVAPFCCALKFHIDLLLGGGVSNDLVAAFKALAGKNGKDLLLIEDAKMADVGRTNALKIRHALQWVDAVTAHCLAGPEALKAIADAGCGVIALLQMSSERNMLNPSYSAEAMDIAESSVPASKLLGYVAQQRLSADPSAIHFSPGVRLAVGRDAAFGQAYRTPQQAVLEQLQDVLIVGSDISEAKDPAAVARTYRDAAWAALEQRERSFTAASSAKL